MRIATLAMQAWHSQVHGAGDSLVIFWVVSFFYSGETSHTSFLVFLLLPIQVRSILDLQYLAIGHSSSSRCSFPPRHFKHVEGDSGPASVTGCLKRVACLTPPVPQHCTFVPWRQKNRMDSHVFLTHHHTTRDMILEYLHFGLPENRIPHSVHWLVTVLNTITNFRMIWVPQVGGITPLSDESDSVGLEKINQFPVEKISQFLVIIYTYSTKSSSFSEDIRSPPDRWWIILLSVAPTGRYW